MSSFARKRLLVLVAAAVVVGAAVTSLAPARAEPAPTLPAGVRVERDLSYGPDPAQRLDVYRPPEHAGAQGAPVIFMVHGGAWMVGDKLSLGRNKLAHWLPRGYVLISTNYRMLPAADPLVQADDVARALAFAQSRAESWGADPARFVLMGHSAGAHLVALISAAPAIASAAGARPWLGTVALDSAAMDVVQIMRARHPRIYDKVFGATPAFWSEASPFQRLAAAPAPAPMMLVCSSQRSDSCPQADAFAAEITRVGGRAPVERVDLTHVEVNRALGQAGAYTDAVDAFLSSLGLP